MKNNFKINSSTKLLFSCASLAALPLIIIHPGKASKRQKLPFVGVNFAHRGLHSKDTLVSENSLTAFDLAASNGYGIELDVQLSRDGQVVVFHDDTLNRVCGVDARVDELTYDELKQLRLNSTDQTIPLFSEVLRVIDGRGPIICELKNGRRNKELCRKTYDIIRSYNGDICIESFNPMIVAWFRFHARELVRGQLACCPKDYGNQVSKGASVILGNCLLNVIARPQFIAYQEGKKPLAVKLEYLLGAMKVVWTSHDASNEKGNDCVIFEFYRPEKKFK